MGRARAPLHRGDRAHLQRRARVATDAFATVKIHGGDRRRVLVLAYYFPPVGGAGVQRTLKFVKYLSPLGWDATVISTRSRVYGAIDETLLAEVPPSTRVVRTPALPLPRYLASA